MQHIWDGIAVERRALADVVEKLSDEQWQLQSAVKGWRIREVMAHLLWPLETPMPRMVLQLAGVGFRIAALTEKAAFADTRTPAQMAQALRDCATVHFSPFPGLPAATSLAEILVHALDVKWPLQVKTPLEPARVAVALDFLVGIIGRHGFALRRGLPKGLRFETTDVAWTHGTGPTVQGSAEALLLSLCGRKVALDGLAGDGAETFRARFQRKR